MLTLLVGAVLVLASLLRLGFVANFISEPVLIGFKAELGSSSSSTGSETVGHPFREGLVRPQSARHRAGHPRHLGGHPGRRAVTVVLLVATERLFPRAPAALIAVAVGIAGVGVFGLQAYGVEFVGQIPGASHPLPGPTSPLPHCSGPAPWALR